MTTISGAGGWVVVGAAVVVVVVVVVVGAAVVVVVVVVVVEAAVVGEAVVVGATDVVAVVGAEVVGAVAVGARASVVVGAEFVGAWVDVVVEEGASDTSSPDVVVSVDETGDYITEEHLPSIEGAAIIGLGEPTVDSATALAPVSMWCGGLCGTWFTYGLDLGDDGAWSVTGIEGPVAIS